MNAFLRLRKASAVALACLLLAGALPAATARADATFQTLPFAQNWSNAALITTDDSWGGVLAITGYLGDDASTTAAGVDPQTILAANATIDVNANQTNPNTNTSGGVAEFDQLANPVIALQGSATADAPSLVIGLNTTGQSTIRVNYNLRDVDGSADNAAQAVALQYRVGTSGNFTNIPAGFVADATIAGTATKVTAVSTLLPAAVDNQAQVQLRIITANATSSDEWVGIDDVAVFVDDGRPFITTQPQSQAITSGASVTLSVVAVGSAPLSYQWYVGASGDASNPISGATGSSFTPSPNLTATTAYWVRVTGAVTPPVDSQTATVTVDAPPCSTAATPIASIQGSGTDSPFVNQTKVVSGTVVGLYQGSGFFVQDSGDSNLATSDGIFVFIPTSNVFSTVAITVGDSVEVAGTVKEFNGQTEIDTVTALDKCGSGPVVQPLALTLPEQTNGDLERYEGMLVTIPQTLTVEQNFFQGRYGQVTLGVGRLFQPTNLFRPGTPEAQALADLNARSLIVLDDARSGQNPNPIPYIGTDSTLRAGDTTSNLTGVLDFGPINSDSAIRDYRLQLTMPVSFTRANPRPAVPADVGGNVKVASANVLNYFTTLDAGSNQCYTSSGPSDCRGANTAVEFTRQRTKIISELLTLDADVVGLMEMENNGPTAVGDLVAGLNAIAGSGTYTVAVEPTNDPISDTTRLGGDAIKVAMIYKPGKVTPQGAALSSADSVFSRAPFAQAFKLNANGLVFSVIVNHFKSKGSCPSSASDPNADKGDGQGCWNALRVQQAQALLALIGTVKQASGSNDVLVIGDLNSYGKENPVQALTDGGLVNELAKRITNPYSYVFDGLAGYLDHALATASLDAKVSGVTEWHNNADEPSVIDYNTEFKPQDLYTGAPFRASDHDPVLIGLQLGQQQTKVYLPIVSK